MEQLSFNLTLACSILIFNSVGSFRSLLAASVLVIISERIYMPINLYTCQAYTYMVPYV